MCRQPQLWLLLAVPVASYRRLARLQRAPPASQAPGALTRSLQSSGPTRTRGPSLYPSPSLGLQLLMRHCLGPRGAPLVGAGGDKQRRARRNRWTTRCIRGTRRAPWRRLRRQLCTAGEHCSLALAGSGPRRGAVAAAAVGSVLDMVLVLGLAARLPATVQARLRTGDTVITDAVAVRTRWARTAAGVADLAHRRPCTRRASRPIL